MVTMNVTVNSRSAARALREELPSKLEDSGDTISEAVSDHAKRGIQRQLSAGGHNTTFTAFMSLASVKKGWGEYNVEGASYIEEVQEGTAPHLPRMTFRLKEWARRHGWDPNALWRHIAMHGTQPNANFMQSAVGPTLQNIDFIAANAIRRSLRGI